MRTAISFFAGALAFTGASVLPLAVHASGTPERLLQVLPHPSDADVVVVRYGTPGGASNGFVFSSDGGNTFKAGCSDLIAERLKIQRSTSPYLAAVALDENGRLIVAQNQDELFIGDGTGCSYTKEPGFENRTVVDLTLDPSDPTAFYALVFTRDPDMPNETVTEVMRRAADGAWTTLGAVKEPEPGQSVFGSQLLVAKTESGTPLMVALFATWTEEDADESDNLRIGISEDGGESWQEHPMSAPGAGYHMRLLAIDPTNAERVLAIEYGESKPDKLLLSSDKGATYEPWAEIGEFSGVTFGADGRVFIADASDTGFDGGVFTATALGEPLTELGNPGALNCIGYRELDQKLFACKQDEFGTLDPATGAFTKLTRLEEVPALIDCPNLDVIDACEAQLNAGPSWCCAGHYPFTEFCGEYDVTMSNGRPVLCGLTGREYDEDAGNGPDRDGGAGGDADGGVSMRDAGSADDDVEEDDGDDAGKPSADKGDDADDDDDDDESAAPAADGDGCSVRGPGESGLSSGAGLAGLSLLLLSLGRSLRRRARR